MAAERKSSGRVRTPVRLLNIGVDEAPQRLSHGRQPAAKAKANCPISKLLKAEISLEAELLD